MKEIQWKSILVRVSARVEFGEGSRYRESTQYHCKVVLGRLASGA